MPISPHDRWGTEAQQEQGPDSQSGSSLGGRREAPPACLSEISLCVGRTPPSGGRFSTGLKSVGLNPCQLSSAPGKELGTDGMELCHLGGYASILD